MGALQMTSEHPHAEWSGAMFDILCEGGVSIFTHVPDAGNDRLIALADASNETRTLLLTTEEEGVAICAGADLVGQRGVLCMHWWNDIVFGLDESTTFLVLMVIYFASFGRVTTAVVM